MYQESSTVCFKESKEKMTVATGDLLYTHKQAGDCFSLRVKTTVNPQLMVVNLELRV